MTGAQRFAAVALVAVLSAVLGRLAYDRRSPTTPAPAASPQEDTRAAVARAIDEPGAPGPVRPEFSLAGLDGKTYGPGIWNGKVLLLNFWATWCPPCRKEIPDLMALQAAYGARGLQIVGIAIDDPKAVQEYATHLEINYPNLIGSFDGQRVAEEYGNHLGALPYTAIVDRRGRIAYTKPGPLAKSEAEAILVPLLRADPA